MLLAFLFSDRALNNTSTILNAAGESADEGAVMPWLWRVLIDTQGKERAVAFREAAALVARTWSDEFLERVQSTAREWWDLTTQWTARANDVCAEAAAPFVAGAAAWYRAHRRMVMAAGALLAACSLLLGAAWLEVRTSWIEAHAFARFARGFAFRLEDGSAKSITFPTSGPYDERMGYTRIPSMIHHLDQRGFAVTRQASGLQASGRSRFVFPLYHEKTGGGLEILDPSGRPLYRARYPRRAYPGFDAIPALVVRSLVFLENRELLDEGGRFRNPAVEWDRLAAATANHALGWLVGSSQTFGGSTLATQMEKFRHSPLGLTRTPRDKMQQMATASARSYLDGPVTRETRRRIVTDYVNSVPLGAVNGYGEVIGLADGLWAWFGEDFDHANRLLARADTFQRVGDDEARLFRSVVTLLVAQRRPAFYLAGTEGRTALERETDSQVRLLVREGIISPWLGRTALGVKSALRERAPDVPAASFVERKAANAVRMQLLGLLGAPSLHALDRYDLSVRSTVDSATQGAVSQRLGRLRDSSYARALHLGAPRLLGRGDPASVGYSVVLYERTPAANVVRVQADNHDVPFDLNSGARLELGSSAKVRTLVSYLEIVEELHRDLSIGAGAGAGKSPSDSLTRWATDYHRRHPGHTPRDMLSAALERRYSSDPKERFFTGGALHDFRNFDSRIDDSVLTVREALATSANLAFIRLMNDVVHYRIARLPGVTPEMFRDPADPDRRRYLERFADRDGRQWLSRFYNRYRGIAAGEIAPTPGRHPLERWVAQYLREHPTARWDDVVDASAAVRAPLYDWLLDRSSASQDRALDVALEVEAFRQILESWRRLGYPYDDLVPSLATTIGSSGDRPEALSELMGIILNDGVRLPFVSVEQVRFAEGTPYETLMQRTPQPVDWVISPDVAAEMRDALIGVVTTGTARALKGTIRLADDRDVLIGGKTGTGQNQFKIVGTGLGPSETRSVSRTATFMFFIGDRFFGTITAHVSGSRSGDYDFTSALPVRLFSILLEDFQPLLNKAWQWPPRLYSTATAP